MDTVLYLHTDEETAAVLFQTISGKGAALVAVDGENWNGALSPWKAPRAFRTGEDFDGQADVHLSRLSDHVIPYTEQTCGLHPRRRMIAGYSLAGLFAIYALYRTDCFCAAASVSGSLWFDGFGDFMRTHTMTRRPERIYFSIGDCERQTKNPRLARVEECTMRAAEMLAAQGIAVRFDKNPGNHFAGVAERMEKALSFLI